MAKLAKPSSSKTRKSQADRSSESEYRLLLAAAQILIDEGYAALTFDRIGEVSGFSRGLASQKFGSKDGLVLAVVDFLNRNMDAGQSTPAAPPADPLDEIMRYLRYFFAQIAEDRLALSYFVLLAATISNKSAVHPVFVDAHDRVKKRLMDMIQRGQACGVINAQITPETVALSIGAFQLGVATQRLLDNNFDAQLIGIAALPAIRAHLAPPAPSSPPA